MVRPFPYKLKKPFRKETVETLNLLTVPFPYAGITQIRFQGYSLSSVFSRNTPNGNDFNVKLTKAKN